MWRRLAVWVAPSMLGILVIGSGSAIADVHRQQATQQAAQGRQARQLAQATTAQRYQVLALDATQRRLTAMTAERDQARADASNANARADAAEAKAAALQAVSIGLGSGPAARTVGAAAGPVGNHFPWGWCTWYVASRRYVPWNGNAGTWLWGARAFGFSTGSTPRPGAIMVTAESIWGHVGYVESVASNGTFTVSEMNFQFWGMVDFRTIVPGRVPVLGFVY